MGLAPLMLWLTCLLAVRNQRILTAWDARQAGGAGAARPSPAPPPQHRHNPGATHPAAVTGTPHDHPDHSTENATCCPEQPRRPGNQP